MLLGYIKEKNGMLNCYCCFFFLEREKECFLEKE